MLIKWLRNEIAVGRCLYGMYWLPRICKHKADVIISWLGGSIVWSRLKRAHKNNKRV